MDGYCGATVFRLYFSVLGRNAAVRLFVTCIAITKTQKESCSNNCIYLF